MLSFVRILLHPMHIISLRHFVLTGEFGPLRIGMDKSEVVELLGKPGWEYANGTGLSWTNYGCYELMYFDGKLTGIQNDHVQAACDNHGDLISYENDWFRVDTSGFCRLAATFPCENFGQC